MKSILKLSSFSLIVIALISTACSNQANTNTESSVKNNQTMEKSEMNYTTLINSFEVPEGKLEESVIYWEACRDFLKTQPGYVSTKLHQSIKDDARFLLVNVAIWETPKTFMEASAKMSKELGIAPPEGLRPNPSLYNVIRE